MVHLEIEEVLEEKKLLYNFLLCFLKIYLVSKCKAQNKSFLKSTKSNQIFDKMNDFSQKYNCKEQRSL